MTHPIARTLLVLVFLLGINGTSLAQKKQPTEVQIAKAIWTRDVTAAIHAKVDPIAANGLVCDVVLHIEWTSDGKIVHAKLWEDRPDCAKVFFDAALKVGSIQLPPASFGLFPEKMAAVGLRLPRNSP